VLQKLLLRVRVKKNTDEGNSQIFYLPAKPRLEKHFLALKFFMPDVIVKKSKIQGRGVFAARDFKKGETVLKWDVSRELSEEEAENFPEDQKGYVAFWGGKYVLQLPPARYVNHSCEPNTFVKDFCDIAKKDIKKGEEITSDYSTVPEPNMNMKCNCGGKDCRGTIRAK